jgi:hypothetical protein
MKIKPRITIILLLSLLALGSVSAQNSLGKTDDFERISLTPVVVDQIEELPPSAFSLLENKMQQIATKNGLGANSRTPRFIITVNLAVISKDVVSGPPMMIAMNIDATFYIADYQAKTVFSTKTISFKAVGTNTDKAYIDGIKSIRPESPEFKSFVEEGKNKIIAYYNDRCDFILQDAKALTSQKQYQEAIFQLTMVPDVCKDCYMKASNAIGPIFKAYLDDLCNRNLAAARSIWIANPNSSGANEISVLLADILPDAACYGEAQKLVTDIKTKVLTDEKRDWNFLMKRWNDSVSLESQRIKAYRDVGVAYGNHQPSTVYHIRGWLW